jgi:hypothetical protein
MNAQLTFPGVDDQLFWFLFNFGLGGAVGSSVVGLCYFVVFTRLYAPSWVANGINVTVFAFFMCVLFALLNIHRALNASRVELSTLSVFGFILGISLPIAAACVLHRSELSFSARSKGNGGS